MAFSTAFISAVAAVGLAATTMANPVSHIHIAKRWGGIGYDGVGYGGIGYGGIGYGGIGYGGVGYGGIGYGGWGIPFASSFINAFNANNNFAHFNDDTLYVNNKDATTANSNVNSFNNANVVA